MRSSLCARILPGGLIALGVLLLAYGVIWQRGPYCDDYYLIDTVRDVVTGEPRPLLGRERIPSFPVRTLNWVVAELFAGALPKHELTARGAAAGLVLANSVLLGGLAWRALRSPIAGLVSGGLFLVPFPAHEALLWASAAGYLVATTLVLIAAHLLLAALTTPRRSWAVQAALQFSAAVACAGSLLAIEQAITFLWIVPFTAACRQYSDRRKWIPILRRAFITGAWLTGLGTVAFVGLYRDGEALQVAGRGGFSSPAEALDQCHALIDRARRFTTYKPGRQTAREVFDLGARLRIERPTAWVATGLASVGLVLLLVRWSALREAQRPSPESARRSPAAGFFLAQAAFLGAYLAICLPGAFIRWQILEYRMLYVPAAFGALSIGSLAALACGFAPRRWSATVERLVLLLAACTVWAGATAVLGYAHLYRERRALDVAQIEAAADTLNRAVLPRNVTLACFGNDETFAPAAPNAAAQLLGVFETAWSGWVALAPMLGHREFEYVDGNKWVGLQFQPDAAETPGGGRKLWLNGACVPPEKALVFTCHAGRAYVLREVTIQSGRFSEAGWPGADYWLPDLGPQGSLSAAAAFTGGENSVAGLDCLAATFDFPLAERLASRGAPSFSLPVPAGLAQYKSDILPHLPRSR